MQIINIKIRHFRLLKEFSLQLEDQLSLIIGKNNSGKTSLLELMNKFLNDKPSFSCDDFNIDFQKQLKAIVEGKTVFPAESLGISMKLFITYDDRDDLSQVA